jgi:hypothetical protein
MKKIISILVIAGLILLTTPAGALAINPSADELSLTAEQSAVSESAAAVGYYISGYAYGPGTSRVSYIVSMSTLTVSGSNGALMSFTIAGSGYVEFGTQPGNSYTASAPGLTSSSWVSV